jgi:hypothetical protein
MQSILPDKIGMTPGDRQKDIDRVRQTLASTVNLEKVVRGTDLGLRATSDRDVADAVEKLRKTITVKAGQDNIFEISGQSSAGGLSDAGNAKLARAIVQKLIDIFVEENLAGDRDETSQTLRFLDDELAKRGQALQEAEQKRAEFEQKYLGLLPGVGSIADRMEAARTELSGIETNLVAAQGSLAALNGQSNGRDAEYRHQQRHAERRARPDRGSRSGAERRRRQGLDRPAPRCRRRPLAARAPPQPSGRERGRGFGQRRQPALYLAPEHAGREAGDRRGALRPQGAA